MDVEELIESLVRALMFLAGVLGNNMLAFLSLPRGRTPLRTNELLFINLAASNLITNYLVDLPDTMADFAGRWFLGETFCGVFRFCADLSETSSIFTTFLISALWRQKLVGSLRRGGAPGRLDSVALAAALLAGSWTAAAAFSAPHFFFVRVEGGNGSGEDCLDVFPDAMTRHAYEVVYLTLANAVPVAGIVLASAQIVVTLLRNRRRIHGGGGQGDGEVKGQVSAQVRAAKSVVGVAGVFLVCWLTHLLLRITNSVHASSLVVEVASYIAASYTCIIPYIFLHGVKKLAFCRRP